MPSGTVVAEIRRLRALWQRDPTRARKVLGGLVQKYGVGDWKEFVPDNLQKDVPGPLAPETTITESFNPRTPPRSRSAGEREVPVTPSEKLARREPFVGTAPLADVKAALEARWPHVTVVAPGAVADQPPFKVLRGVHLNPEPESDTASVLRTVAPSVLDMAIANPVVAFVGCSAALVRTVTDCLRQIRPDATFVDLVNV